jgi:hypothetical protein
MATREPGSDLRCAFIGSKNDGDRPLALASEEADPPARVANLPAWMGRKIEMRVSLA